MRLALLRRRFRRARILRVPVSAMHPAPLPLFHLLQTLFLFRRKDGRDIPVRLSNRLAHAAAGVAPDFFELRARFFDDRRDFGHLLVRQSKLPL